MRGDAAIPARPAPRLVDWGLPIFAAVSGAALVAEGFSLPLTELYAGIGAGFAPLAVGLCLLAVAAGLALQVMRGERFEPEEAEGADAAAPVTTTGLALAAAAVVSPIATFPLLGFPIGAALAFALVARAFGSTRSVMDLALGAAIASAAWWAFSKLGVQLGPFLPTGLG